MGLLHSAQKVSLETPQCNLLVGGLSKIISVWLGPQQGGQHAGQELEVMHTSGFGTCRLQGMGKSRLSHV